MNWVLTRFCNSPQGTFGVLDTASGSYYTVERPWDDNKPNVSCIPQGGYQIAPRHYYRGDYPAIELKGVPQRSYILLHVANTMWDVQGCIGVGYSLGCVSAAGRGPCWAVMSSKLAFDSLMNAYEAQKPERLEIYERIKRVFPE